LLVNATVKAVEADTLVLTIGAAPLAKRLSEQRNTEVISAALRSVLGVAWRVRCDHDGGPGGRAPAGAANGGGAPAASPPPAPTRRVPSRSGQEPPLPPEPPPYDEEEMLAEAAADASGAPTSRRDPEEVAIELLSAQLGARAVDDSR
jgi:DNA polymerase-3 subunit gamma/tau